MTEQRYKAVLAVIGDGRTVTEVARDWGVNRKTLLASGAICTLSESKRSLVASNRLSKECGWRKESC